VSTSHTELLNKSDEAKIPLASTGILLLLFLLLISEVSPTTALYTVLIVCTQTFIGLTVSGFRFNAEERVNASSLLLGFFFGTIVHVILDQILRSTGYRVLVLPFITAAAVAFKYKELVSVAQHWKIGVFVRSMVGRSDVLFVSLLLVLIPLSQIWSWSRYSAVALMVVYLLKSTGFRWLKSKFLIVPTLFVVVFASRIRPSYWWLPGWGIDENSIYARAIYSWGPKGDVLLAGVPLKYQWFGYSWMGLMAHDTSAKDFEFVSRTAYVICAIAIVLAVYAISNAITQDQRKSLISTFIVVASSTAIGYPVAYTVLSINYLPIAFVSILCWILLLIKWIENPTTKCSMELAIVGVVCVSTKSVHLVPIVVIPGVIAVSALLKKKREMLLGVVLTVGLGFLYTRFYFPSQSGTGLKPMFADFTRQFGVIPETSSIKSRILMLIIVIGALSTVSLLLISMKTKSKLLRLLRIPLTCYFAVAVVMAVTFQRVSSTEMHFLQVFVLITIVLFASSLTVVFDSPWNLRLAIAVGVVIAVFLMYLSFRPIVNDEKYVLLLMKANFLVGIALFLLRCFLMVSDVKSWRSKVQIQRFMVGSLILVSVANFVFVASTRDIRIINKVGATHQLGQAPLREAANWINQNTNANSIVATNLFFGEGGTDNCEVSEPYLLDSIANQALNTNYYTPVALVHRRFLAAGVQYASISYADSVLPRIRTSLRPACFPDNLSRSDLKKYGVDFYIAYRPNIKKFNFWSELGKVEFQNDQYVVIRVN